MATTFGERLSDLLKEKGLQQQALAQMAGVTEAAVSHYIKGTRVPRASVMGRIAKALGTTSDFLISGIEPEPKDEFTYVKRLIARNVKQMTKEEKLEIMSILLEKE